ncbi:MAG: alanine--tRNA ligase [bacterium]|nr:alanine--tRNA ligase [bacterium]
MKVRMTGRELKARYIEFFVSKNHKEIGQASLIPEHDPSVLFTTAGMHPLVPYLLGEPHPQGRRLVNVQRCLRTDDIDEVGDEAHLTFFEMLGNWSLGDYFKEEAIQLSYEFLTEHLGIEPERLWITVFAGDDDAPRDDVAANIWKSLGISDQRIHYLSKKENWWGPAGQTGPCGPDTEMFYDVGKPPCGPDCRPACPCQKFVEIWNDVFMEYNKTADGCYLPLRQKNVDTGLGVERVAAVLQERPTVFETELFAPIVSAIKELSTNPLERSIRIIADHLRASTFLLAEKLPPSNVERGYVLRRLIRRAIRHGRSIGIEEDFTAPIAAVVVAEYAEDYPHLAENRDFILAEIQKEERRFKETLQKGMREFERELQNYSPRQGQVVFPGERAFYFYETFGFPVELTEEMLRERLPGAAIDRQAFEKAYERHRQMSRAGAEQKFRGGLADATEKTTRLHTATHLLHQALRTVLSQHVEQRGSNITPDRLRFDFSHPAKMTADEIARVERIVNETITEALPIEVTITTLDEAKRQGAIALFADKYGDNVKVYAIGDFSKEVCGGPHVSNTSKLGRFKIIKEEACSAGVRRIRAVLEEMDETDQTRPETQ